MKRRLATSLIMATISGQALAQEAPGATGSYVVSAGSIGGAPATILLDRATGKTWYLGEVDSQGKIWVQPPAGSSGSPLWVPIAFAPAPPKIPPR
jgi:hypothetical protein